MIIERALEYLILANIEGDIYARDEFTIGEKQYSMKKVRKRIEEIRQEILEPYVIDANSKE